MKQFENVLQERIDMYTRLIKEVEESPATIVPRSTKLLYELNRDWLEAKLNCARAGRPMGEGSSAFIGLFRSMGLEHMDFPDVVDYTERWAEYDLLLGRMGYPQQCCERIMGQLAMTEMGELPKPHIVANAGHSCDIHAFVRHDNATLFGIPTFYIDTNLNEDDKPHLADLDYVVEQLGEFIEWAESKVPGIKYDEGKAREIYEMMSQGEKYRHEIFQLIKHVPCPVPPRLKDVNRMLLFDATRFPDMKKANEYLRLSRDELGEKVAKGQGPYDEERLRLLWAGEPIVNTDVVDVGKLLMQRKVAMPLCIKGEATSFTGIGWRPLGEVSEYGIVLSPLQATARELTRRSRNGAGKRWVNITVDVARAIGAHGIIHFNLVGCTPTRGMDSVVADRAEKELGIPTLKIEGRLYDQQFYVKARFEEALSAFIDKCFDWAGKPRQ